MNRGLVLSVPSRLKGVKRGKWSTIHDDEVIRAVKKTVKKTPDGKTRNISRNGKGDLRLAMSLTAIEIFILI